jgi:hypothetical protein
LNFSSLFTGDFVVGVLLSSVVLTFEHSSSSSSMVDDDEELFVGPSLV